MADAKKWELGKADAGQIWVRYFGTTPAEDMKASLNAILDAMPEKDAQIVMDLRGLDGHNPEARAPVQDWLMKNKKRIGSIVVLLPKAVPIVKLMTAAVGFAVGVKLRVQENSDLPEPKSFSVPPAKSVG